jgi:hypothetical protein
MDEALLENLIEAVAQQLASKETAYVAKTHARLITAGLSDEEARVQIALCLGQEMDNMLKNRRPFDEASYRELLGQLPCMEADEEE